MITDEGIRSTVGKMIELNWLRGGSRMDVGVVTSVTRRHCLLGGGWAVKLDNGVTAVVYSKDSYEVTSAAEQAERRRQTAEIMGEILL
jgi:hypothetical protein